MNFRITSKQSIGLSKSLIICALLFAFTGVSHAAKYKIGVSLKLLYVAINRIPPIRAGATSSNHVNRSVGLIPDQTNTATKTAIHRFLMGLYSLQFFSSQILSVAAHFPFSPPATAKLSRSVRLLKRANLSI